MFTVKKVCISRGHKNSQNQKKFLNQIKVQIICCHLELDYQFILSSWNSLNINLSWGPPPYTPVLSLTQTPCCSYTLRNGNATSIFMWLSPTDKGPQWGQNFSLHLCYELLNVTKTQQKTSSLLTGKSYSLAIPIFAINTSWLDYKK